MKNYWIYILASGRNGTLYVGITNDYGIEHAVVFDRKQNPDWRDLYESIL